MIEKEKFNKVIMNYGLSVQNGDSFASLPIHIIDGVLCNYTFTKMLDDGIKYHGELGQIKEDSMLALGLEFSIVDIPTDSAESMRAVLAKNHSMFSEREKHTQAVLYRFEKTEANDTIFYGGLNITPNSSFPYDFFELGIEPKFPFFGVPMEEMFAQTPEIINKG